MARVRDGGNVLLISLDTLRVDVAFSGKYPTIERLRALGATFSVTVSPAPITPISHASILTGLNPRRHGLRHLLRERMLPTATPLAEVLHAAHYQTGAVVASPGMNRWYGLDRGFDHYDDEIPRLADGRDALTVADVKLRGTALKRAPLVTERAFAWFDRLETDRPFFLFVHYFDAHWPYAAPTTFSTATANAYEDEVAYMDHYLGQLLDGLEQRGVSLVETMIVLLSDHGEDLAGWYANDHSGQGRHPEEDGHGCLLFDCTQLVPLVMSRLGTFVAGATVSRQVRLIDVAPTILDALNLQGPEADGISLLSSPTDSRLDADCETRYPEEKAESSPAWAHLRPLRAIRRASGEKVMWVDGESVAQKFDLTRDPNERYPTIVQMGSDDLADISLTGG